MEEKTYSFELKEIDEQGVFEGYASIFGKPDVLNEVIEKGAFTRTIKAQKQFPMLWYHDPRDPIGIISELEEDDKGLKIKGELNLEVQSAREKYFLMKQKAIRGLSIGFNTTRDTIDGKIRRIQEIKLFEISPCTFQAHPAALISTVKNAEYKTFEESLKSLEGTIKFFGEIKSGKMISSANLNLINNAVQALVAILKKLDPSDDTQDDKKGIYSSIIEGLENREDLNTPHKHLFESALKVLGQI